MALTDGSFPISLDAVTWLQGSDVLFSDDGEESTRMTQSMESDASKEALSDMSFVCIKILRDTAEFAQFNQICE